MLTAETLAAIFREMRSDKPLSPDSVKKRPWVMYALGCVSPEATVELIETCIGELPARNLEVKAIANALGFDFGYSSAALLRDRRAEFAKSEPDIDYAAPDRPTAFQAMQKRVARLEDRGFQLLAELMVSSGYVDGHLTEAYRELDQLAFTMEKSLVAQRAMADSLRGVRQIYKVAAFQIDSMETLLRYMPIEDVHRADLVKSTTQLKETLGRLELDNAYNSRDIDEALEHAERTLAKVRVEVSRRGAVDKDPIPDRGVGRLRRQ